MGKYQLSLEGQLAIDRMKIALGDFVPATEHDREVFWGELKGLMPRRAPVMNNTAENRQKLGNVLGAGWGKELLERLGFDDKLFWAVWRFRGSRCLRAANLVLLGDLASSTDDELLAIKGFGEKSLAELRSALKNMGLTAVSPTDWSAMLTRAHEEVVTIDARM